jgi:D-alanyl-D-alanine carboxypeptidase/D-alanyl-D-alanine-endopeptidase (penicillin-binding protein 4)
MDQRPALTFFLLCLLALVMPEVAEADVEKAVDRALSKLPKEASVSVYAVRLPEPGMNGSPKVVIDRRGNEPRIPASNLKVLTSAAALAELGDDYRFKTRLYLQRDGDSPEAKLVLVGGGDPSFGDLDLYKELFGNEVGTRTILDGWAKGLSDLGITKINRLMLDATIFDDEHDHPNWPENQKHLWYEAQVGGLNLNINTIGVSLERAGSLMRHTLDPQTNYVIVDGQVRSGKKNAVIVSRRLGTNEIVLGGQTNARTQGPIRVTIDGPTAFVGTVFAEALAEAGLSIGVVTIQSSPDLSDWQLLAVHETPLETVLKRTNEDSINLYAESLIKLLGHRATGDSGSWASGAEAMKAYLEGLGVPTDDLAFDDGSGMSRNNRVTAQAIVAALTDRHAASNHELYRTALSDAGSDGTLTTRFRDRPSLRGRVWGKTGYIRGVSTMSGYLHASDGHWYAISVLVNDCPNGEIWKAKAAQEAIFAAFD